MAATAQMQRQDVINWEKTFPNEQITTVQSVQFIKKMVALSISHITYLRGIFPENAYGDKKLEDIHLKILSENSDCYGAKRIINYVRACFDAIEKKYLSQLILAIYTNKDRPDTAIETYNFRFLYSSDKIDMSFNGESISKNKTTKYDFTKQSTLSLLKTIIMLTQSLEPIPENAYLTMKLLYYDEITPKDYEPLGFEVCESDDFNFTSEVTNIKVGEVATPFHVLKLRVKTASEQFAGDNNECAINLDETCLQDKMILDNDEINKANVSVDDFKVVNCPCGNEIEQETMIQCRTCKKYQHAICWAYIEDVQVPECHKCHECNNDLKSQIELKEICQIRQALIFCKRNSILTLASLKKALGIDKDEANAVIAVLEKEAIVSNGKGKNKNKKCINKTKLVKKGLPKFMKEMSFFKNVNETQTKETNDNTVHSKGNIDDLIEKTVILNINSNRGHPRKRTASTEEVNFDGRCSQDSTLSENKRRKASVISGLAV